jgi:hypothetical protein
MAILGNATNPATATNRFSNKQANADWYKSLGMDQGGDNEIGAIYRRLIPGLAEQAFSGQALRSELEPQRQGAVRSLVALGDPSNMVANARAGGGRVQSDALASGRLNASRLGQLGAGMGTQWGAVADAQNQGVEQSNNMLANAYDPQNQAKALIGQLQAIQQAGGDPLEILMQMFSPLEQRSNANKQDKAKGGLSGLGGILGSVLPGMNFSSLLGGGSGGLGGSGSNASSGYGDTGVPF